MALRRAVVLVQVISPGWLIVISYILPSLPYLQLFPAVPPSHLPDPFPRSARDTFFTVGLSVDLLSAVFLFFWTWIFSPFRSKRLFQLLPLFLLPGCLLLAAILAWEAHGVSNPESLGMVELKEDADGNDADGT